MAMGEPERPTSVDARARARARRREQAAGAAARAGGMLSLAVVLLGAPGAVHHHTSAPTSTASRPAQTSGPHTDESTS
jgi:hypothetical protein